MRIVCAVCTAVVLASSAQAHGQDIIGVSGDHATAEELGRQLADQQRVWHWGLIGVASGFVGLVGSLHSTEIGLPLAAGITIGGVAFARRVGPLPSEASATLRHRSDQYRQAVEAGYVNRMRERRVARIGLGLLLSPAATWIVFYILP